jgi:hypothetical protein
MNTELELIEKLTKDLKDATSTLTPTEARFLVDYYYQLQHDRIKADGQIRSMSEEPHRVIDWLSDNTGFLENQIRLALAAYSRSKPLGRWAMEVIGIGPVLSAGLLAHIDFAKAPTVGHIWRFAGLDPTCKWEKKTKRPFNAKLKVLTWKIGESFVKVSGNANSVYGKIYVTRKLLEEQNNQAGKYAEQAAVGAARVGKDTEAYKHYSVGRLPPGHIHARAKRYAVKMFLSHYWEQGYWLHYGKEPPKPFAITSLTGHAHYVEPEVSIVKAAETSTDDCNE